MSAPSDCVTSLDVCLTSLQCVHDVAGVCMHSRSCCSAVHVGSDGPSRRLLVAAAGLLTARGNINMVYVPLMSVQRC